jgi:hypothetical protein
MHLYSVINNTQNFATMVYNFLFIWACPNAVLAEGNDSDVITAIGHIAKSIGMTKIAH